MLGNELRNQKKGKIMSSNKLNTTAEEVNQELAAALTIVISDVGNNVEWGIAGAPKDAVKLLEKALLEITKKLKE